MTESELARVRDYIVTNIMRNADVMYLDNIRDIGSAHVDLPEVIASLYEILHREVTGKPYEYMFHWANKVGSDVNDNLFLKEDK